MCGADRLCSCKKWYLRIQIQALWIWPCVCSSLASQHTLGAASASLGNGEHWVKPSSTDTFTAGLLRAFPKPTHTGTLRGEERQFL